MTKIFEEFSLKITATANQKNINFLDIPLNLHNGKFQFFNKSNADTLYINSYSDHSPSIIKQLSDSISRRISKLSSDSATFQHAAPTYNDALKHLKQSGFHSNMHRIHSRDEAPTQPESQNKKRSKIYNLV